MKNFKNLSFLHSRLDRIVLFALLTVVVILGIAVGIYNSNPLTEAYVVYSDGNVVTAMTEENDINELLADIKAKHKKDDNEVYFHSDISVKKTLIEKSMVKHKAEAKKILNGCKEEVVTHVVKAGETLESIALHYETDINIITKMNPKLVLEYVNEGTEIRVIKKTPVIQVKKVFYEREKQEINYDTILKKDDSMYEGETSVTCEGENGEMNVVYKVVEIDGLEKSRNKVREEITVSPKNKIVVAGTKLRPKAEPTGSFTRPYSGNISSRFGRRWGRRHNGIDITGPVGDIISASDGGEVIHAGWDNGGFGNLVIIKHNNGYESYYAHLSEVLVEVGQKVAKDEAIGKLGNTGRSTGPHLHFEIRKNGVPSDPLNYTN